jgi:hypothetical protein
MTANPIPEPIRLSKKEMQEFFNKHILERLQNGEFSEHVVDGHHANPYTSGQVFCTNSEIVSVQDKNQSEVALIHRYLLPQGALGASKLPDPVKVEWEGKIYKLKRKTDK